MESNNRPIDGTVAARDPGTPGMQGRAFVARLEASKRASSSTPARWLVAGLVAMSICVVSAATLWFVGAGSVFDRLASVKVGELRAESTSVPPGSAGSVAVNVNMGEGTFTLAGGATGLLDADFSYNVDAWKPQVTYSERGGEGTLSIEQTRVEGFIRTPDGVRNEWSLRLKDGIPITLAGSLGSGTGTIKTDGLSVSRLDMSTGAGNLVLDLTGNWKQNLSVNLQAGAGNTTIRLPKGAGARVKVESGAGQVDSGGLTRAGSYYTNAAYGKTPVTLEITVRTGAGDVKIEPER